MGGSGNLTRTELYTPEASSRIKFATGGTAGLESSNVGSIARRKVTFARGLPGATAPEPSRGLQLDRSSPRQRAETVPELSYELHSGCSVTATISGRVCRALAEHCGESNVHGREVGGILVGHRCERRSENEREYSLSVTDLIPVRSFDSSSAHISLTEDEWIRAERELGQKYTPEGKCRLGWYHTHPVQGIFFSTQDHRAHNIFVEAYQFALVVDPRSMEAGLFYWSSYQERILAGPICFALRRCGK